MSAAHTYVLSDREARPWVRLACQQRDHGDPIFDIVDANGAHGSFGELDLHLVCSPFAVRNLGLQRFEPRAGCYCLASPAVEDGRARWLLKSGEIVIREMTRDEIEAMVIDLERASTALTVLRVDVAGNDLVTAKIFTLKRQPPKEYRYLRASDVHRGWLVAHPARDYLDYVVAPVVTDPRCSQPLRTEDAAIEFAGWLADSTQLVAADIEAFLRRAPMPRDAIARLAVFARECHDEMREGWT